MLLAIEANCRAQSKWTFISNETLKHSIGLVACDSCVPIRNKGYRVIVHLTAEERQEIKSIDCREWMSLLNDTTSDYAANLILYSIYDKDAHLLSRRDSREIWIKYSKVDDLAFRRKKLCTKSD